MEPPGNLCRTVATGPESIRKNEVRMLRPHFIRTFLALVVCSGLAPFAAAIPLHRGNSSTATLFAELSTLYYRGDTDKTEAYYDNEERPDLVPAADHDTSVIEGFLDDDDAHIRELAQGSLDDFRIRDELNEANQGVVDAEDDIVNRYPTEMARYLLTTDGGTQSAVDAIESIIGSDFLSAEIARARLMLLESAVSNTRVAALHDWISDQPEPSAGDGDSQPCFSFTIRPTLKNVAVISNTSDETLHDVVAIIKAKPNVSLIESTEGQDNDGAAIFNSFLGFSADTVQSNYKLYDLLKLAHEQEIAEIVYIPEMPPNTTIWVRYLSSASVLPYMESVELSAHCQEIKVLDSPATNFHDVVSGG